MSTKEKLVKRFCQLPKDFTFEELTRLMHSFGFELYNKGASSGSRVAFIKGTIILDLHKPHPGNIIRKGTLKNFLQFLKEKKEL
jgi:hypothetical protein